MCGGDSRIPLPGLAQPESQLGIPLLVRDELVGVLCIETERSFRFHEEDRTFLELLGGYLAIAIQNALLRERTEDGEPLPYLAYLDRVTASTGTCAQVASERAGA